MASLLLRVHDRTHLDCAIAGAWTPLRPGHGLFRAVNVNHKVASKLFFGVCIWAVNDFGLAVAHAHAGCRRSWLKPDSGTASGLREGIIEGRVICPELLLVRLAKSSIIVMDEHHIVHTVSYRFLGALVLRPDYVGTDSPISTFLALRGAKSSRHDRTD